jgi:hypothetical protein
MDLPGLAKPPEKRKASDNASELRERSRTPATVDTADHDRVELTGADQVVDAPPTDAQPGGGEPSAVPSMSTGLAVP